MCKDQGREKLSVTDQHHNGGRNMFALYCKIFVGTHIDGDIFKIFSLPKFEGAQTPEST